MGAGTVGSRILRPRPVLLSDEDVPSDVLLLSSPLRLALLIRCCWLIRCVYTPYTFTIPRPVELHGQQPDVGVVGRLATCTHTACAPLPLLPA